MNLYIVENSNYLCERLTRLVTQRRNVQVVGHAGTAEVAVREIERLKPDVVLLDIRLDQSSGLEVLKQIKPPNVQAPLVIVLTNYPYPQYRERFFSNGADYFFDKSAELDRMLQALDLLSYRVQQGSLHSVPGRVATP